MSGMSDAGTSTGPSSALPVDKERLLAEFVTDAELRLVEKTVQNYASDIRIFLRWLDQLDPLKVGDSELRGFLLYLKKERGVGDRAILRYFSAIQSLYQFLEFEGRLEKSPILRFRKRYLAATTKESKKERVALRRLLEVDEARGFVLSIIDPRDRALAVLLLKTGIRREEASDIDVEDLDWSDLSITLKEKRKRTNPVVFFDDETARVLKVWLAVRMARGGAARGPLFLNATGGRLEGRSIYNIIREHAERMGLYDEEGTTKQKFTVHATRHFFTTHLMREGMRREHVKWLRGDAPGETMDVYHHIDPKSVREEYREKVPRFGL